MNNAVLVLQAASASHVVVWAAQWSSIIFCMRSFLRLPTMLTQPGSRLFDSHPLDVYSRTAAKLSSCTSRTATDCCQRPSKNMECGGGEGTLGNIEHQSQGAGRRKRDGEGREGK